MIYTVYAKENDMTFIMEKKDMTLTVTGFYFGEPNEECTNLFKRSASAYMPFMKEVYGDSAGHYAIYHNGLYHYVVDTYSIGIGEPCLTLYKSEEGYECDFYIGDCDHHEMVWSKGVDELSREEGLIYRELCEELRKEGLL